MLWIDVSKGQKIVPRIRACALPGIALLRRYLDQGAYVDCYATEIDGDVPHSRYVMAFYSSWLFKIERWILDWSVKRPSSSSDVVALADGTSNRFAAWEVEARDDNQLLLCDLFGRTRSWLMTATSTDGSATVTRLYFGSAVVPRTGSRSLGFTYRALLGFHKLYSRALLHLAKAGLQAEQARLAR